MPISYDRLYEMALGHKGGDTAVLEALLPTSLNVGELKAIPDSRWLSMASKAIFSAGFNWSVVDKKWPNHEVAFEDFEPGAILMWPDEKLDELVSDASIIRHGAKIRSVIENARFFDDLAREHGTASAFFAEWPQTDYFDLLASLKKRGSRMGGTSVQYFLRTMGMPAMITTRDVVAALMREGVVDKAPTSKSALAAVQNAANDLMQQSGRDLSVVSRVLALSVG